MHCIQIQENQIIQGIVIAPQFVRNDIYKDLKIKTIMSEIKQFAHKYSTRLQHTNMEVQQLLEEKTPNQIRSL